MTVRAAVVGLGWWGRTVLAATAASEELEVCLGVDPDPAGRAFAEASGVRAVPDLADALADPDVDAVVLCSPHEHHVDQMVAVARAGKHVFCEKPFSDRADRADLAIAAIEHAGVVHGIGHERRFEPAVQELTRRVREGDLGVPLVLEGNFSQDKFLSLPADNWRLSAEHAPVGPLSATGIHLVDLAISILGTPTTVWARLSTRATAFANGDTLTITLGFAEGGTALITAVLTTPFLGRVCVLGSEGWMEIRDRSHPEDPSGWDVTVVHRGEAPEVRFFPPHPAVRANLEQFARAVMGTGAYPVSLAEIRSNVRAFEAVTRSVVSGRIEQV